MSNFILSSLVFTWFQRERVKVVEIYESYISSRKLLAADRPRQRVPLLVVRGNWWHLSLITLPRHCSPSLRHISYSATQSSVAAVGSKFSAMKDSHTCPSLSRFCGARVFTQIWSSPRGCTSSFTSGVAEKTELNLRLTDLRAFCHAGLMVLLN